MNFIKCSNCKKWGWEGEHRCEQKWEAVVIEPWGDDPDFPERECFGDDAERAALYLAAISWSNSSPDYPDDYEIWVRISSDDRWSKFGIQIEMIPDFIAIWIDEEGEDGK